MQNSSLAHIDPSAVRENYLALLERVRRAGGDGVHVVAVTKSFATDAVVAAMAAGCSTVAENYAQELIDKLTKIDIHDRPKVHFIGRLQSNKVRVLAGFVDIWQTVDRESLIDEIAHRVAGARILIQVNATQETKKGGCRPENVEKLLARAVQSGLIVEGLMTVGPTDGDADSTRSAFRIVAHIHQKLDLPILSMGMTNDLEIAIDEGSTLIRVGSGIFGKRPPASR